MSNTKFNEERLTELQEELKTHPAEERDAVYEEMVADGGFNPLEENDDPHALITQLKDEENDTPKRRIINYLLAFIPLFAIPFLVTLLNIFDVAQFSWSLWLVGLYGLLFAFIGRKRRSDFLSVFWLGIVFGQIGVVPSAMASIPVQIISVVASLFVLGGIGRLIHKNRYDNLFTAFATLPIVSNLVWMFGEPFIFRYITFDQFPSIFALQSLASMVLMGISLGLFFIGRQRGTKWMGIFVSAFSGMVSQIMFFTVGSISSFLPILFLTALMSLTAIGVPAFFFWRDGRTKEKQPDDLTAEPAIS